MNGHPRSEPLPPSPPAPQNQTPQKPQGPKARPITAWAAGPGIQAARSASSLPQAGVQPQPRRQNLPSSRAEPNSLFVGYQHRSVANKLPLNPTGQETKLSKEAVVARRKKQDAALGVLIVLALVIGIPLWLISKASDAVGPAMVIVGIILAIIGVIAIKARNRAARRAYLLSKYGDSVIVDAIMRKNYWHGQTHHQLVDSIGSPSAVDDQFLKTKKRQVWKYQQTGKNRYKLRLTLENDIVVGWDQKA